MNGHDVKFDSIREAAHKDALDITRSMTALHERVAVVEEKHKAS